MRKRLLPEPFSLFRFCFCGVLVGRLSACTEVALFAGESSLFALLGFDNIDDHASAVHTGLRIHAMTEVCRARLVGGDTRRRKTVM